MMVVVVDIRKSLWIKGISLQHPYNQKCLVSYVGFHANGCTLVVALRPLFTRLSNQLQLQQQILILRNYDKST